MTRRTALSTSTLLAAMSGSLFSVGAMAQTAMAGDPLPSWNDSATKKSIMDFVSRLTESAGPDYVAPEQRVATFDNDGTLWAEQPMYFQLAFIVDRVKTLAPQHPEWKVAQPFQAILENDLAVLTPADEKGMVELVAATHSGMTTDEFTKIVTNWIATARHPRFKRLYTELIYQPMVELLAYLRANGFKTFIVSGGGIEFMRPWVEKAYGIPPEQVVGSSGVTKFQIRTDGKPELMKEPGIEFVNDGPGKPVGINRFIGRRPLFAFGNSDGDLEMLQWTAASGGRRFMGLVHHTDAEREFAYDRKSSFGRLERALDEARAKGWCVVDMKTDWRRVFPFE